MRPKKILLTGASGFVGQHLQPMMVDNFTNAQLITPNIDISCAPAVDSVLRATKPDVCVHLAGITSVSAARDNPERSWKVNLHGTLNLADAIRAHAPHCVFMYVSSGDAYGSSFRTGARLNETAPLAPINLYAATKAAADLAVGMFAAEGLRAVRLRPFNHTGPGQSPLFAISGFARQLARIAAGFQEPVLHVGSLNTRRDFLDVRDVCDAYIRCIQRSDALPCGAIFNIASGVARRIGDVLDELIGLAGLNIRVETDPSLIRPTEIPVAAGDADCAQRTLGWSPHIPWSKTLRDLLDHWYLRVKDPDC